MADTRAETEREMRDPQTCRDHRNLNARLERIESAVARFLLFLPELEQAKAELDKALAQQPRFVWRYAVVVRETPASPLQTILCENFKDAMETRLNWMVSRGDDATATVCSLEVL